MVSAPWWWAIIPSRNRRSNSAPVAAASRCICSGCEHAGHDHSLVMVRELLWRKLSARDQPLLHHPNLIGLRQVDPLGELCASPAASCGS